MRTGPMNKRIVIQTPTESQNTYGEPISSWGTFATVWAEKKDKPGRADAGEKFAEGTEYAFRYVAFYIHYRTGVKNKMRISYDSEYYDIVYIREIGNKEGLEIGTRLIDE